VQASVTVEDVAADLQQFLALFSAMGKQNIHPVKTMEDSLK